MSKSHDQQVQFIRDCIFASNCLDVPTDRIDLEAHVDGQLTLEENWRENIKPQVMALQDSESRWDNISEEEVRNEIEKYKAIAEKTPGVEFAGDME